MEVLFNNGKIEVFTNGSGEIFVKCLASGEQLRIGDSHNHLVATVHPPCRLHPWMVNGLEAFVTSGGKH